MLLTLLAQTSDIPSAADTAAATAALGTAAAVGVGMLIFWIAFWVVGLILFIVALIDVLRRNFSNPSDKTLWIILIIVLYVLGPILYFIIGKKKGTLPA